MGPSGKRLVHPIAELAPAPQPILEDGLEAQGIEGLIGHEFFCAAASQKTRNSPVGCTPEAGMAASP